MDEFRPKLLEAETAAARVDALCEFIEFLLGPRQPTFGESVSPLYTLPFPFKANIRICRTLAHLG